MSDELTIVRLEGFDEAIVGVASRKGYEDVLAYDSREIVKILIERDDMTEEEAIEFFFFNIQDAWMGEGTPVFISFDDEILEHFNAKPPSVQLH